MNPRKLLEIALGIVTAIGGFLEVGSIATAAQAGAAFSYQLIWPIALGTLCIIVLIEMSGRLAAVSHHPLPAAVRERFGFNYFAIPLAAETVVDFLVLASEIGGASIGLQILTGIPYRFWCLPVALLAWFLLWRGNFGLIEYGVSFLGLITVVFIVAAFNTHPAPADVVRGLIPSLPSHDKPHYWFLAVSIIGATISPYLCNFYSSGAVEDKWGEDDLVTNRAVAILGMSFGGLISIGVLVAAAGVLSPRQIRVEAYEQVALITATPLGLWGYWLFGAGLFIACLGAALEISLDIAYVYSQSFGWNWGENIKPRDAARFSTTYTFFIFAASILILFIDPLKLTLFAMAITTVILPLIVLPFLVLLNDPVYIGKHPNGRLSNTLVFLIVILASVLALVAIPLEIFGGS
jgi:Mn2+/Fe2+ NRAMP family transporter